MSGFVEVGFPFSGLGQSKGAPAFTDMQQRLHASSNASHWSFLTASTGQHPHFQPAEQMPMMHQCRKRSFDQASHANDHSKRVRTEMPLLYPGMQQVLPSQVQGISNLGSMDMECTYNHHQQMAYPSSYTEHQTVVLAEQKYHSSLLETLLREAHGC